ncbi:MAG: ABC transporter ATP-binding protein [Spirochaetaceae bacterium]|nr:ABC transporter ATP-binding protein [Spirochaetaceae bacterium]
MEKKQLQEKPKSTQISQNLFRSFYKNNKLNFIVLMVLYSVVSLFVVSIAWIMSSITDTIASKDFSNLWRIGIISVVFAVGFVLIGCITEVFYSRFIHKGIKQYKSTAFSLLSKKGIAAFSGEKTSDYISAFTNDITSIETNYLLHTPHIVQHILQFFGTLGLMLYFSIPMTGIAIAFFLLPIIISVVLGGGLSKREKIVSEKNAKFTARIKDLLTGFSVIKGFKAEKQAIALFNSDNAETEKAKMSRRLHQGIVQTVSTGAHVFMQFGLFIVGAILAIKGYITAGVMIAFVQLCNGLSQPLQTVPVYLASRKAAKELVYKLADKLEENKEKCEVEVIKQIEQGIEIKNLSFGYEDGKDILKNISYKFEQGKKYALVGFSGSGKTTLLNLLMGSYNNYGGTLSIGGTELKNMDTDSLYEHLCLINQNVFLFDDTIRNNITLFSDFPAEKVDSAIRLSSLDKIINERGEDYLCGENGSALSGGERQRISIARALVKNASVLLVDEATSALDNETASLVSNEILKLDGITGIVVTHRLETNLLKKYDAILMLKNGELAEVGTFDELMEQKGQFYSLYTVQ